MWPFSRKEKIEHKKEENTDSIVERNFQATLNKLSDLKTHRDQYTDLCERITDLEIIDDEVRIPIIGREDTYLDLNDRIHYPGRAIEMTVYFNIMTWEQMQEYPINLLKRSFIRWAEKEFGFGYSDLVGS